MTPEPANRHSFHIRVPDDLWERLVAAAEKERIPHYNTIIVRALERWLDAMDARKKGDE